MARTGRPPKIQSEDSVHLVAIVQSDRIATLDEIGQGFKRRIGIDVHEQTIPKLLDKLGIQRVPSDEAIVIKQREPGLRRYGYRGSGSNETYLCISFQWDG